MEYNFLFKMILKFDQDFNSNSNKTTNSIYGTDAWPTYH